MCESSVAFLARSSVSVSVMRLCKGEYFSVYDVREKIILSCLSILVGWQINVITSGKLLEAPKHILLP